jgi:hypothetical protein
MTAKPSRRWFQEPYVWMVVGGPLLVVLASVVTVVLAVRHPDPVLNERRASQVDNRDLEKLSPEERKAAELSVMPAGTARNHVVSPTLPKDQ